MYPLIAMQILKKTINRCDFPGCIYVSDNVKSVAMHQVRCHKTKYRDKKVQPDDAVSLMSDSGSVSTVRSTSCSLQRSTRSSQYDVIACASVHA